MRPTAGEIFWFTVTVAAAGLAYVVATHVPPDRTDDLEARITVSIRLELSNERARRLWPELNEPGSDLARRMTIVLDHWRQDDDERLRSTDLPFLLAQEAAKISL